MSRIVCWSGISEISSKSNPLKETALEDQNRSLVRLEPHFNLVKSRCSIKIKTCHLEKKEIKTLKNLCRLEAKTSSRLEVLVSARNIKRSLWMESLKDRLQKVLVHDKNNKRHLRRRLRKKRWKGWWCGTMMSNTSLLTLSTNNSIKKSLPSLEMTKSTTF